MIQMDNDLISRSDLLELLEEQYKHNLHFHKRERAAGFQGAYQLVYDAPAVDAVPVVRCRDCKWGNNYDHDCNKWECSRSLGSGRIREDDYCSYGVKKELDNG